jgi:uncharacterized protein YjbJ (UPF0337 family)
MGFADKVKNSLQSLSGKGKQRVGGATGNRSMQAEGAGEKVKDAFKR